MADKILKEAFDKLTAIEEGDDYVPMSREEREKERRMRDARNRSGEEDSSAIGYPGENTPYDRYSGPDDKPYDLGESSDDHLHDKAIDLLDDMLDSSEGETADILRYAIRRLQEVGLGR